MKANRRVAAITGLAAIGLTGAMAHGSIVFAAAAGAESAAATPSWPAPTNYVETAERLVKLGTADALATASLLRAFGAKADNQTLQLARQASGLAPARADLVWLAARLCANAAGCDPAIDEAQLQKIDPENGTAWLGTLARARAGSNEEAVNVALRRLASAQRLDLYFNSLVVATAHALTAARGTKDRPDDSMSLGHAAVEMAGILAGVVLPPFQPLATSCSGRSLKIAGRNDLCRGVAQVFERGDTFLANRMGLSIEQRLWPPDSQEGRAVAVRRRTLQYRFETWTRVSMDPSKPSILPDDYLDVLQEHEREQDVAIVYLRRAGVPLEPPKGWVSSFSKNGR